MTKTAPRPRFSMSVEGTSCGDIYAITALKSANNAITAKTYFFSRHLQFTFLMPHAISKIIRIVESSDVTFSEYSSVA